ncbi:coniferyl-aldehyde dehydrogenase, partial [Acinetobacter gerneri]
MNSQTKTMSMTPHSFNVQHLKEILEHQKLAYQRYPVPTAKDRIDRLARLKQVLVKYQDQMVEAINADYGNRSVGETKIGELLTCIEQVGYY